MTAIPKILEKLYNNPEIKYKLEDNTLSIIPDTESGFLVWLTESTKDLTVGFEGWHEHFQVNDEEDALDLFALGLSTDCRLKIVSRGNFAYKWVAEMKNEDGWQDLGTTSLIFFPFWKSKKEKYHQNKYLKTFS